ncbi:MAG: transcription elongation factor GreA [Firmicutes bacterium]|nr:transcription elongation factor GreA [Bacillota bacterium]MCL5040832.1 transcription elongation factor GreA [Bacillota bacterium]
MPEKEVLVSEEGLRKLEEELEQLKSVRRREVAERIRLARSFGDLSENSEYEDAKNEQAFIEGRILTLEKMLRNARIIKAAEQNPQQVTLGTVVKLRDLETGEEASYRIVGSTESDPGNHKISNESPVGRALMNRKSGDRVEVNVPLGIIRYEVLEIGR